MTNKDIKNKAYITTGSGSIDYQYYAKRSNKIRSESIFRLLKRFFSSKKNSRLESQIAPQFESQKTQCKNYEVITNPEKYGSTRQLNSSNNPLNEAA